MNTPDPCNSCKHCYYDALQKDCPDYDAECWKEVADKQHWGDKNCPYYEPSSCRNSVMSENSKAIDNAFEAVLKRIWNDDICDFIWNICDHSSKVETDFYNLIDFIYDTECYTTIDAFEVAISQGQKYHNKPRYTVWWGSSICWFFGTEKEILARLTAFHN